MPRFGARDLGIFNPRDVCGNVWPHIRCDLSFHAEGRAGDDGFPVQRPHGHPDGRRLADWLVEHADELGVQEVIWAGRRWTSTTRRWSTYSGRSDHFDHVHWALTRHAAAHLNIAAIAAIDQEDDDLTPDQARQLDDLHAVFVRNRVAGSGDQTGALHDLATPILATNHEVGIVKRWMGALCDKLGVPRG